MGFFSWARKDAQQFSDCDKTKEKVISGSFYQLKSIKEEAEHAATEVETYKAMLTDGMARAAALHDEAKQQVTQELVSARAEVARLEQELADATAKADFHSNNSVTITAPVPELTSTANSMNMAQQYQTAINGQNSS